jgi:hypothetical protein
MDPEVHIERKTILIKYNSKNNWNNSVGKKHGGAEEIQDSERQDGHW